MHDICLTDGLCQTVIIDSDWIIPLQWIIRLYFYNVAKLIGALKMMTLTLSGHLIMVPNIT